MSKQPDNSAEKKPNFMNVFLEEISGQSWLIPILAIFSGFFIGAIIIILTTEEVYQAFGQNGFGAGLRTAWDSVSIAYSSLFRSSIGSPTRIAEALSSGNSEEISRAFGPFFESLVSSTPFIFAGLAVAVGFKSGLFNIGAEGQLWVGAMAATFVGFTFTGLPAIIHIPLALIAGAIGGGLWGFIPGWLKANTGGHEVINTIMMNYIAVRISELFLSNHEFFGFLRRPESTNPISPIIAETAMLPRPFESPIRFHLGFFIALFVAYLVYWFMFRSTWGFAFRTVGANPNAARYAGIRIKWITIAAMTLSGALAGLAGTNEVLGVNHKFTVGFSDGLGFDAIAIALLGKNHPVGVVLASLLFGFLRNGAIGMQLEAGIPIDIIGILQALILAFIAAPAIIRSVFRLRAPAQGDGGFALGGWGN